MCIDRNSKLITLFLLTEFKLTTNGEVGQHGQRAPKLAAVVKRPMKENVMIRSQIMEEQIALEMAKKLILAINSNVQVTKLLLFILCQRHLPIIHQYPR